MKQEKKFFDANNVVVIPVSSWQWNFFRSLYMYNLWRT